MPAPIGIRDVALGARVVRYAAEPQIARALGRVGSLAAVGEIGGATVTLVRREGIDRAAAGLLTMTSAASAAAFQLSGRGRSTATVRTQDPS